MNNFNEINSLLKKIKELIEYAENIDDNEEWISEITGSIPGQSVKYKILIEDAWDAFYKIETLINEERN